MPKDDKPSLSLFDNSFRLEAFEFSGGALESGLCGSRQPLFGPLVVTFYAATFKIAQADVVCGGRIAPGCSSVELDRSAIILSNAAAFGITIAKVQQGLGIPRSG